MFILPFWSNLFVMKNEGLVEMAMVRQTAVVSHLPDSQARCSRGLRPSLAESLLSSTYWGREDDLDIEYSLIFQQNAKLNVGPLSATLAQH